MFIIDLYTHKRMDLIESSDLSKANNIFENGDYSLRVDRRIDDKFFLKEFSRIFNKIKELGFTAYGEGVDYSYIYKLPNLKRLNIDVFYDINFEKLTKLTTLDLMWNKKFIKNIDKLKNLEHLSISEFDEKDLTKLSALTNLKSLSLKTAKIKSLKGIETLINLKVVSLGGVRSLTDISDISALQNIKYLEFDICWKLKDFSPIGKLKELEVLRMLDCKNLTSIKFVKNIPKLHHLTTLGTTIINDYDTTPAENIPVFFGSLASNKYNKQYPEKEIKEGQRTASTYL